MSLQILSRRHVWQGKRKVWEDALFPFDFPLKDIPPLFMSQLLCTCTGLGSRLRSHYGWHTCPCNPLTWGVCTQVGQILSARQAMELAQLRPPGSPQAHRTPQEAEAALSSLGISSAEAPAIDGEGEQGF